MDPRRYVQKRRKIGDPQKQFGPIRAMALLDTQAQQDGRKRRENQPGPYVVPEQQTRLELSDEIDAREAIDREESCKDPRKRDRAAARLFEREG